MFEEDVDRLPKRVVEDLDDFLMDERIVGAGVDGVRAFFSGKRERQSFALASDRSAAWISQSPSGGPNPITMSSG